eukprot:SAG11_NODE_5311_length_1600_cov_0.996669_2_plen_416_part_01
MVGMLTSIFSAVNQTRTKCVQTAVLLLENLADDRANALHLARQPELIAGLAKVATSGINTQPEATIYSRSTRLARLKAVDVLVRLFNHERNVCVLFHTDGCVDAIASILNDAYNTKALNCPQQGHGTTALASKALKRLLEKPQICEVLQDPKHHGWVNALLKFAPECLDGGSSTNGVLRKCKSILNLENKRTWLSRYIGKTIGSRPATKVTCFRADVLTAIWDQLLVTESGQCLTNSIRHLGPLDVLFSEENGTGSGVRREWLTLVTRELFKPERGLMTSHDGGRTFHPNPFPHHLSGLPSADLGAGCKRFKRTPDGRGVYAQFTNATAVTAELIWVSNAGVEKKMGDMAPAQTSGWSVYPRSGCWIAKAPDGKEVLRVSSTTVADNGFVVGEHESESWVPGSEPSISKGAEVAFS